CTPAVHVPAISQGVPTIFYFQCNPRRLDVLSFPPRGSSDLDPAAIVVDAEHEPAGVVLEPHVDTPGVRMAQRVAERHADAAPARSEEHTTELQSLTKLVYRLLLGIQK